CSLDLSPKKIKEKKYKVCLEYHIGNCTAPCVGLEKDENYTEYLDQIETILKGNTSSVIAHLGRMMLNFAEKCECEEANKVKEQMHLVENYRSKSTVVAPNVHEVDVITMIGDERVGYGNYVGIVNGAIVHGFTSEIKKKLEEPD